MSEPSPSLNSCPQCGAALPSAATKGLCPKCLMAEAMVPTQDACEPAPSRKSLAPAELAPHFPQLEILECLGRGGMGVVYKARQKSLNRVVALKLLAPERVADAKFAQRFAQEAQALATLNHPSIVTIHDFGQAGGFYFLLMEFVDGVNLRQAMKAGRFTPEQALAVVPPVCEALQYAHEHGIVHRDIKPENLLLDKDGRVKIADFGIAKMLNADGAQPWSETQPQPFGELSPAAAGPADTAALQHSDAGTPQYMAPEQKEHRRTDHRADIYSLGVVLYELLTGELPADKLQPPSSKVQIDVRLDEIVLRALEKTPELRFQTATDFRTQVLAATDAMHGTGAPAAHPPDAVSPSGWKPPTTGWGHLALLLLLLGIVIPVVGIRMHNDSVGAAAENHMKLIGTLQRGVMSVSEQIGEANAVAGRAASRAGNSEEREETRAQAREEGQTYRQRSAKLQADLERLQTALATEGNRQVDAHPWRAMSILVAGLLLAIAGAGMLVRLQRQSGADTTLPPPNHPARPRFQYAALLLLMVALLVGILFVKFAREADSRSGVTNFKITPVEVRDNVFVVDVTTVVARGNAELRAVLDGSPLPIATEAALRDAFSPAFPGTFIKPTSNPGNQAWRILPPGTQTWQLGFVLPDAALAKEAFANLRPIFWLPAEPGRTVAGTLFEVRQTNGQEFHATLKVALPFTSADPDWVSVFGQIQQNESVVTLTWDVLAAGNGLAQFSRAGSPILVVQPNSQTRLRGVTAQLELTKLANNRVQLVRRLGGEDPILEDLPGDFRELADELLRTATFSAKGTSGTHFELCRIQGKPFTVQVHITDSPSAYRLKVAAVVGLGVLFLPALLAGVLFLRRRKQGGAGKAGSIVKAVLLLASVPVLLLAVCLVLYWAAGARRATDEAQSAMAAARAEVEAKAGLSRTTTPAIQPALAAWQQGDKGGAASNFLAADWNAGPIFAPESMLSLSESEYLTRVQPVPGIGATRNTETKEEQMLQELRTMKELVAAVSQAGLDAAAKNNAALARKHFDSLMRFGKALDQPNRLNILRLEGRAIQIKAGAELQNNAAKPLAPETAAPLHTQQIPTKLAVGVRWFTILAALILFGLAGGGIVLLVLLFLKRSTTAAKVLAVLGIVALLLFLLVAGLIFVWGKTRHEKAVRAETLAHQAATAALKNSSYQMAEGDFPSGAHIGRSGQSVLVTHDTANVHYVFYYIGYFGSASSGSQNAQTRSWVDEGSVKLKNGRTFGYRREALHPDELTVNGARHDLGKGQVFVLNDDGTLTQRPLSVPLSVARDPVAMGQFITEHGALPANVVGAVWRVHTGRRSAAIDAHLNAGEALLVFIGEESLGWASSTSKAAAITATVEASSEIRLDDGSFGQGFIFRTSGATVRNTVNVAITPGGPVPFGEWVFRSDDAVSSKDGIFTFADIHQPDGKLVPVSVRVRTKPPVK